MKIRECYFRKQPPVVSCILEDARSYGGPYMPVSELNEPLPCRHTSMNPYLRVRCCFHYLLMMHTCGHFRRSNGRCHRTIHIAAMVDAYCTNDVYQPSRRSTVVFVDNTTFSPLPFSLHIPPRSPPLLPPPSSASASASAFHLPLSTFRFPPSAIRL